MQCGKLTPENDSFLGINTTVNDIITLRPTFLSNFKELKHETVKLKKMVNQIVKASQTLHNASVEYSNALTGFSEVMVEANRAIDGDDILSGPFTAFSEVFTTFSNMNGFLKETNNLLVEPLLKLIKLQKDVKKSCKDTINDEKEFEGCLEKAWKRNEKDSTRLLTFVEHRYKTQKRYAETCQKLSKIFSIQKVEFIQYLLKYILGLHTHSEQSSGILKLMGPHMEKLHSDMDTFSGKFYEEYVHHDNRVVENADMLSQQLALWEMSNVIINTEQGVVKDPKSKTLTERIGTSMKNIVDSNHVTAMFSALDEGPAGSNTANQGKNSKKNKIFLSGFVPSNRTINGLHPLGEFREGYLNVRLRSTWTKQYFYNNGINLMRVDPDENVLISSLQLCSVRREEIPERPFCFVLHQPPPNRSMVLQAISYPDMQSWIENLQSGIEKALAAITSESDISQSSMKSNDICADEVFKALEEKRGMENCVDCGEHEPGWVSLNLGVRICISCSGGHRNLGIAYSQVRSILLDRWDQTMLDMMLKTTNALSNEKYEMNIKPEDRISISATNEERYLFLFKKYKTKSFCDPQYQSFIKTNEMETGNNNDNNNKNINDGEQHENANAKTHKNKALESWVQKNIRGQTGKTITTLIQKVHATSDTITGKRKSSVATTNPDSCVTYNAPPHDHLVDSTNFRSDSDITEEREFISPSVKRSVSSKCSQSNSSSSTSSEGVKIRMERTKSNPIIPLVEGEIKEISEQEKNKNCEKRKSIIKPRLSRVFSKGSKEIGSSNIEKKQKKESITFTTSTESTSSANIDNNKNNNSNSNKNDNDNDNDNDNENENDNDDNDNDYRNDDHNRNSNSNNHNNDKNNVLWASRTSLPACKESNSDFEV